MDKKEDIILNIALAGKLMKESPEHRDKFLALVEVVCDMAKGLIFDKDIPFYVVSSAVLEAGLRLASAARKTIEELAMETEEICQTQVN